MTDHLLGIENFNKRLNDNGEGLFSELIAANRYFGAEAASNANPMPVSIQGANGAVRLNIAEADIGQLQALGSQADLAWAGAGKASLLGLHKAV